MNLLCLARSFFIINLLCTSVHIISMKEDGMGKPTKATVSPYSSKHFEALVSGDVAELERFLKNNDVHTPDDTGKTLLCHAFYRQQALKCHIPHMKIVRDAGASYDTFKIDKHEKRSSIVRIFIEKRQFGFLESFAQKELVNFKTALAEGEPLLNWITRKASDKFFADLGIFELLLQKGARVNLCTKDGLTPLLWALKNKLPGHVSLLLEYGAIPDGQCLLKAVLQKNTIHVENFLKRGVNPNAFQVFEGAVFPVLSIAVVESTIDVVKTLLNHGAQVNIRDEDGNTPLHYGVQTENIKKAELLLRYGAFKNIRNNIGITPLDKCREKFKNTFRNMQALLIAPKRIGDFDKSRSQ